MLLTFALSAPAVATPQIIRVDGSVFDGTGAPLNGVTTSVQVSAFTAATGGSALWASDTYAVQPTHGRFTIHLDTSTGGGLAKQIARLGSSAPLWFEISYNSVVVNPRSRARGTMFAVSAASTDRIAGYAVSTATPNGGDLLKWSTSNSRWEPTASTLGLVSSVGLTMPGTMFGVTGSTITTSGTLGVTLSVQNANLVLAGPTSAPSATPTFRSLVSTDLPLMPFNRGGLNAVLTAVSGAVLYGTTTATALTTQGLSGQALLSAGSGAPTWGSVGISRGGSGASTAQGAMNAIAPSGAQAGDLVYFDGTNWTRLAKGSTGQVLASSSSGLTWITYSGFASGQIVMWSGSAGSIPSGWVICDGTNGTPDLRDKFIVGAGSTYSVGDTGGSLGSHNHTATPTFTGTAATSTHTATSSFSSSDSFSHGHTVASATFTGTASTSGTPSPSSDYTASGYSGGSTGFPSTTHTHNATPSGSASVSSGPGNTSVTSAGTVSTTIDPGSWTASGTATTTLTGVSVMPSYFSLAYIMKQ